ncbi:uncharacterized protein LOC144653051 isoform X2 [Oculina patagonica]
MSNMRLSSPFSTEYCRESGKKPPSSYTQTACMMSSAHLNDRSNDRSRPNIYSSPPGYGSYFPFLARKCGCAECIIASDKLGTNSLNNNQNGYKHSNQSEYFLTANGYNQAHQTKGRLVGNQVYNAQSTLGNGNGITVWPEKYRSAASTKGMQTHDFNSSTYIPHQADHSTSKFYQSAVCSQSATTPVVDKTNSFTRLLNTANSAVAGNEAVAPFWPWCGTSSEFNNQTQQHLSNIHQTYNTKQISRDPRLRKKSERANENDTLTSNKDSIYQANANFVPVSEMRKNEGYKPQSEANKKNLEETNHSSLQATTSAPWWNFPSMSQYPKAAHAPTFYPERSAPAMGKQNNMAGDERKGQRNSVKQPMQLTLNELSNKRGTFLQGTDSHGNQFPWNHPSLPTVKTCTTSEAELSSKGPKSKPKALENFSSRKRHGKGDPDSFKHSNSLQKKKQSRIHNNDLENDQDAKTLEIYAREERIRNLKTLLVKHEQALDALRVQRKSSFSDETIGNTLDVTNSEILSGEASDQEYMVGGKEESCSPSGVIYGNSLKRRWLKNWNEEDQLDHKSQEKIEKRNEVHSNGTQSDDENQNLSNAEFTALEGLVRLSKD